MGAIRNELVRTLPVQMTADDREEQTNALIKSLNEVAEAEAEAERAANNAVLADLKKKKKAVIDSCIESLSSNTYQSEVDCEERWDYDTGIVSVIRLDTMEEIQSREMTTEEVNVWRQRSLPGVDGEEQATEEQENQEGQEGRSVKIQCRHAYKIGPDYTG